MQTGQSFHFSPKDSSTLYSLCAPLGADLFLFCYERDFMKSLSRENQADVIEAFNSTSSYLDDLLNIEIITLTKWWTAYTLQNSN